jgi:hypothetical protein
VCGGGGVGWLGGCGSMIDAVGEVSCVLVCDDEVAHTTHGSARDSRRWGVPCMCRRQAKRYSLHLPLASPPASPPLALSPSVLGRLHLTSPFSPRSSASRLVVREVVQGVRAWPFSSSSPSSPPYPPFSSLPLFDSRSAPDVFHSSLPTPAPALLDPPGSAHAAQATLFQSPRVQLGVTEESPLGVSGGLVTPVVVSRATASASHPNLISVCCVSACARKEGDIWNRLYVAHVFVHFSAAWQRRSSVGCALPTHALGCLLMVRCMPPSLPPSPLRPLPHSPPSTTSHPSLTHLPPLPF